eukprot:c23997_g1_i1 orf=262-924(+)
MDRTQKLRLSICIAVGFFGVVATVLAIVAEIKRVRVDEVVVIGDDCFYPSNPAWALGIFAASSLLVAQIIANACGGCICCCSKRSVAPPSSHTTRTLAILCLVLSWIAFANAFFLLLEGAALNGQQELKGQGMIHSCYIIKPGVFGAGAGLCMFTCGLAIVYYLMATSASSSPSAPTLRIASHISSHHYHVGAFNPDYSFTPARLPYVAGLELPKAYDQY